MTHHNFNGPIGLVYQKQWYRNDSVLVLLYSTLIGTKKKVRVKFANKQVNKTTFQ